MKHTCKAPNCQVRISASLLMCPRHWAQVPRTIQVKVVSLWRALARGVEGPTLDAYQAARAEAIAAVTPPQQGDGLGNARITLPSRDGNRAPVIGKLSELGRVS